MITGIDHLVIVAHSLERAIETYRRLGFTVMEGGLHPYGSYNALIGFADGSYIELLGFYEEAPAHPWWDLLHERGGGLIDFCMATDDIHADRQTLLGAGVSSSDLYEGGRDRPDGYVVKWINNKVEGEFQGRIPFIIEDVTPRQERLPAEREHANGVTGIDCLILAVDDPRYAAIMADVAGVTGRPIHRGELGASGMRLEIGGHTLEYLLPDKEGGPLSEHLARNASVPFAVSFKTTGAAKTFAPVETGGLRMSFERDSQLGSPK
ncbi:MAG: VOC family protein [Chloroflexi bacterium]|nr:VOC family protein [Chloroflexota bacterium]